ncbi:MAG: hypothetical protein HDQ88_03250 [Clostridia bacterium]|nr:hypothetical protein [Clostridia bacterium]
MSTSHLPADVLGNMRYIHDVGTKINDMPTDAKNRIVRPWHLFPAGTDRDEIKSWFTDTFNVKL